MHQILYMGVANKMKTLNGELYRIVVNKLMYKYNLLINE